MIEVVIVDSDAFGSGGGELPGALARLTSLGLDVVLVDEPDQGDTVGGASGALARIAPGPGRLFVWSGRPPVVRELAGAAGRPGFDVLRQPVEGECPQQWAQRRLAGAGRTGAVCETRHPSAAGLAEVAAFHVAFPQPVEDPDWLIEVVGSTPELERSFESWFSVGNGRTGTRGTWEEGRSDDYPATYVAGVFGCDPDEAIPELVRGPEWTRLWSSPDPDPAQEETHRRVLDMRQGIFVRHSGQGRPGRVTPFRSARFASLADRELMCIESESLVDPGPHSPERPAVAPATVPGDQTVVEAVTAERSGDVVSVVVKGRGGGPAAFAIATHRVGEQVSRLTAVARAGVAGAGPAGDERLMAAAGHSLAEARSLGIEALRARHRQEWRRRWRDSDVVVGADPSAQRALRFSLYHLISSADPEDDLASVGARGLTGPGYRGHVFWDTEVYVLPFFVWTHPATARALLAYRHRTLPAARAKAEKMGYEGALYAWESADTGEECTPDSIVLSTGDRLAVHTGAEEHHISADVAWAVWEYWKVTADAGFLVAMGAEILIETARFWASRVEAGDDGRFHIREVIGPDEYHEHVDDSAFTNVMARWNLRTAIEACETVSSIDATGWKAVVERTGLGADEAGRWEEVAASLVDGFDPATLLYEQFAGFYGLEDLRAADLAPRPFTGEAVVGLERLRRSQVVKQADVVMLARLLPDEVSLESAVANYRFYEPLTCHGSSLSPALHALVAARTGALEDAAGYFAMASGIDLDDRMGNAREGVHVATMGGLWQAAVLGFGGVRVDGDTLRIDPILPAGWDSLAFPIQWRGTRVDVRVDTDGIEVDLDATVELAVGPGPPVRLGPGRFASGPSSTTAQWRPA